MKKQQHNRAAVKKSDAKSHERKMASAHKHVLGGVNDSGYLPLPKSASKKPAPTALRGR
jgi:hypothetical protein